MSLDTPHPPPAAPATGAALPRPDPGGLTYFDQQFNIRALKLLPGERAVTRENLLLVTVLGACVAVCMRDPVAGVGGMTHFLVPDAEPTGYNHGGRAMAALVGQLIENGAQLARLEAKIFGGARVHGGFTAQRIGLRSGGVVRGYLAKQGIPIRAEDLGDVHPRKIFYFPRDGRVMVKKLNAVQSAVDLSGERAYQQRLSAQRA